MMCFASTSLATAYHYLLGREAPYGYLEPPVLLGNWRAYLMFRHSRAVL